MSPDHNRRTTIRRLAIPTLALVLVAGACSDDDTDLDAAACDAYADVGASFFGDPAEVPGLLDALEAAMPASLQDDATTYADAMTASFEGDEAAMADPAFLEASDALGAAVYDGCDSTEKLDVAGIDYGYEGIPSEIDAGRVAIRFTNETELDEAHEMFVARKADGVTESLSELLALPEDEAMSKIIPTAVVFSDTPGGEATTLVDLEAGEYLAFCMIPTVDDGAPHASHGMATAFTVS
ncbi:hypothetical protein [Actinospongicola halichondriae]|uniref:hypothetical protein n=1 Tax=Actinospongicola halichondriae TaxID=3236844 RepID=UPI003D47CC02